jgi:hypothetical protein
MIEENALTFEVNVIPLASVGELVPPPHYNFRHPRRTESSENTNIVEQTQEKLSTTKRDKQRKQRKSQSQKITTKTATEATSDKSNRPSRRSKKTSRRIPLRPPTSQLNNSSHNIDLSKGATSDSSIDDNSDNQNNGYNAEADNDPTMDNSDAAPAEHVQLKSNTPEYRQRRRQATEIARFHTYGAKKRDRILREYGPKQLGVPDDDDNLDYSKPRSAIDLHRIK